MPILDIIYKYEPALIRGLWVTIKICMIVWFSGIFMGLILGIISSKFPNLFGIPFKLVAFTITGIPILIILLWIHYPLQSYFNILIDPFWTTCITLSIVNIFAIEEIIRRAIILFPSNLIYSGIVCGLNRSEIIYHIQLPLIVRETAPNILFVQVIMLQSTIFASFISVQEFFRVLQQINSSTYQTVDVYSLLAIFFLLVCLPLNGIAFWLKNKFKRTIAHGE